MKIFTATSKEYAKFNGPVEVVRPTLPLSGPDIFLCAKDGRHFHAYGEELRDPPAPLLVHAYDTDTRTLISENLDIRLAFPQGDEMEYLAALNDILEDGRHFASTGVLYVPAHAQEPLHVLAGDL